MAPVIIKFIYHSHVDFILRRSSWLKGIVNSQERRITIEECLAPSDRTVKAEARKMKLFHYTRKQRVYVQNPNFAGSNAIEVKDVNELLGFRQRPPAQMYFNHSQASSSAIVTSAVRALFETPQPPPLTRKPPTAVKSSGKAQKRNLPSPEQQF